MWAVFGELDRDVRGAATMVDGPNIAQTLNPANPRNFQ